MEYTPQNVEFAVSVFYSGEQNDRAKAHTWLTAAQRVPEAWTFMWELLQPTKGTEVQFFAATTLHTKILRCWAEVPPESHDQLKEKILQAIFAYAKGPKIVTNRLCISLAAFILQRGAGDLVSILQPLSNMENTSLLIEVLTVIPEEYDSMTMGSGLKVKNRAALRVACPAVLDDMLRYLQTVYNDFSKEPPSEELILSWTMAATCASSWLTIEGDDVDFGPPLPDRLPLFRALLSVVHLLYTCNEIVSDTALDACEACLSAARAAGVATDPTKYPTAGLELLAYLATLAIPIMAKDNVPNSPNEELLSALITCCVALSESHARTIVEAVENTECTEQSMRARQLLEVLLDAQGAPGRYPAHETRSNLVFGIWYTLQMFCYSVLGEWCWGVVEAQYAGAADGAGGAARREAALHVFLALDDAAPHARAPHALTALLRYAVHQAHHPDSSRALSTALHCLGAYASWLSSAGGGELARACVSAAGAALPHAPADAALALRKLCADCKQPAAALAPDIVRAAQNSQWQEAWTRRQLIGAAGAALAAAEPDVAGPLLAELAGSLLTDLNKQSQDPAGSGCAGECCVALLGSLSSRPELAADVLRALIPTLRPFASNPLLTKPMLGILKQAVLTFMGKYLDLVEEIAELTITALECAPCASGLDVVKLVAVVYGGEWAGCSTLVVRGVRGAARGVCGERPDLAEGLFVLLHALTKKRPHYLHWLREELSDLVQLACSCLRMWTVNASRASCCWLSALAAARPHTMQPHAPTLTADILACIGGGTPRNQIEPLAELLLAMNRAEWRAAGAEGVGLAAWLRRALDTPGFPSHHATDAHKQKFMAAVVKEKSSKRRLLDSVQEFSLVCRGLIGTEYARQCLVAKQLMS